MSNVTPLMLPQSNKLATRSKAFSRRTSSLRTQKIGAAMFRTMIFAGVLLFGSSAFAQRPVDHLSPRIDMGELTVSPGVAEFNLKVAQLFSCLSRSPTDTAKVVSRRDFDNGQLIRIEFASGRWMEFAFRAIGHASLLMVARGSDGLWARTPDETRAVVLMLLAECRSKR